MPQFVVDVERRYSGRLNFRVYVEAADEIAAHEMADTAIKETSDLTAQWMADNVGCQLLKLKECLQ